MSETCFQTPFVSAIYVRGFSRCYCFQALVLYNIMCYVNFILLLTIFGFMLLVLKYTVFSKMGLYVFPYAYGKRARRNLINTFSRGSFFSFLI